MKNTGKRILSLLLTAVVLMSLLTVSALADYVDPLAGLASLGEFTPPVMEGQEVADPSTVDQNTDASAEIANDWTDYKVIATGDGEKLERWGQRYIVAPRPPSYLARQVSIKKLSVISRSLYS